MYRVSRSTLAAQLEPSSVQWLPAKPDEMGWTAARALNAGVNAALGRWVVCAHQDVLFPHGWWDRTVRQLEAAPQRTAVAGPVGTTSDGAFRGHVLDPHGHRRWLPLPAEIVSLDEHLLILRRSAGLRFDPATPGFHCFGTDIALTARDRGLAAVALDAPVVHLSGGRIDDAYDEAARWLLDKWGPALGYVIPRRRSCSRTSARRGRGDGQ